MTGLIAATLAFVVSFVALTVVEKLIHWFTKNPDKSYQWGVWTFSIMIAIYFYFDYLGR